jgi:PadR family transcriptional regulator PadR
MLMAIQVQAEILDGMVLAILTREDYYGYALTKEVQSHLEISESTMYPVLKRLQKNDFLSVYDKSFEGRNRRYYSITPEGEKKLLEIRLNWLEFRTSIDGILMERGE